MKTMSLLAAVLALGLTFGVGDADAAKRLGGGKSAGMQREMTVDKTPGATPAQTPTAPMAATAPAAGARAAAPAAAAAQSKRSWMGPLAGIAAGIGLAALAFQRAALLRHALQLRAQLLQLALGLAGRSGLRCARQWQRQGKRHSQQPATSTAQGGDVMPA